jgi:hypothetical protein
MPKPLSAAAQYPKTHGSGVDPCGLPFCVLGLSGSFSRSAIRQRVSHSGSRSRRQASVVTAISGTPESFNGRTTAAYKTWLQDIQPANATYQCTSFITKDVAECFAGVWYIGKVQCIHQGIRQSMTRNVSSDSILPNKSQPFSIVWEDDTDTICDLSCLLTYLGNVKSNRHKADATRSSTIVGLLMVRPPLFPRDVPAAAPAHTAGIFAGIPSRR